MQEKLATREGTSHLFPRLSSLPLQPRAVAQLTRTISEYFLSLLLYCSHTSIVFVQFPYCSLGFALFSCSRFHQVLELFLRMNYSLT